MSTLPHDVWLHVAQYLPALFVRDLLTVNRSFFEIAMDCRYRQLIFAYMDNRMLKNLVRLRDAAVAKRVRIVHIYPGFLPDAYASPSLFDQTEPQFPTSKRSFFTVLLDIANALLEQRNSVARHSKYQPLRKPEDPVQLLAEVLGSLPNLTEYYVTWYGLPAISSSPAAFVVSPLQPSLRKLSLNLSLENVKSFPSSDLPLSRLEEFHLCIHSESVPDERERTYILQTQLAPVIGLFRDTLKTLAISSWEPTDLSPLFSNIDRIPALDDLTISIPVEPCHLGDPAGVKGFLQKHRSTLQSLRLRATQYGGKGLTPNMTSLHEWVSGATDGVQLPKLRVLDITSSLFPADSSLSCLQRFSRTLSSLSVTGSYKSYADVVDIVDHFADSPASMGRLRIGPVSLSPQLVDLVASRIPGLSRLELLVRDILPVATEGPSAIASRSPKNTQINAFVAEMESRRYAGWNLQHLSLVTDILPQGNNYGALLEEVFFECIPALRYFA